MPKVEKYIEKKRVRGTDFITGTDKDGNVVRFSGAFFIREIVNESNYLSLILDEQEARIAADELLDDKIATLGGQMGLNLGNLQIDLDTFKVNVQNDIFGPGGLQESLSSSITQTDSEIRLEVERLLYGEGGITESYNSAITQTAQSISSSVDMKLYGEGGIEESYSSLIQQTAQSISLSVDEKLYGPGGVEESYSSLIQQTAQSIVLSVESELYGPDGIQQKYTSAIQQYADQIILTVDGTLNDFENEVYTEVGSIIQQSATDILLQVDGKIVDVKGEITTEYTSAITIAKDEIALTVSGQMSTLEGDITEAYKSAITVAKGEIALTVDGQLTDLEDGITQAYQSAITVAKDEIGLSVSGQLTTLEGDITAAYESAILISEGQILSTVGTQITDLDGRVTTNSSSITQLSGSIDLSVFTNGQLNAGILIERVNDYEGAVRIAADKIQIDGSTTFAAGYNPYAIQSELAQYKTDNDEAVSNLQTNFTALDEDLQTLNTDFNALSQEVAYEIHDLNGTLFTQINNLANRKNTRYISATEPVPPAGVDFRIGDEWVKEIEVIEEGETTYEYESYMWFGTEWRPNLTTIDGARITTGVVDAARIIATELFAQEIGAVSLHVAEGFVGGFKINNMLVAESEDGKGISIDPTEREILIKDLQEGLGISQVSIRAGDLTPEAELNASGGIGFKSSVTSDELNIRNSNGSEITSSDIRATGGVTVRQYVCSGGVNKAKLKSTVPAVSTERFVIEVGKNYVADLPYNFRIYHNLGTRNGRSHKLHGDLKVTITSRLVGRTAEGVTKELVAAAPVITNISRSTRETTMFERPVTRKVSFYSIDCTTAYWEIDIKLEGDLTYQQWTSSLSGKYWMTSTGWGIDYRGVIPDGCTISPSMGIMEMTTSGFQFMWGSGRFFKIDGRDPAHFITSQGKWVHNGDFQLNGSDIVTIDNVSSAIAADLSAYATKTYVDTGFYTRSQSDGRYAQITNYYDKTTSDGRFAKLAGDGAQDFNVKDLIIHGQVNQWLAQQLVVDDARIQVNRKQDGVTVDSGLVIHDRDTGLEVSRLVYDVNGIWRAGGQRIFTDDYNPKLGGYSAASYPRKAENAVITGAWTINNNLRLGGGTARNLYTGSMRIRDTGTGAWIVSPESGAPGRWYFRPDGDAASTNAFVIKQEGVGIGTEFPQERLHVAGNGLFTGNVSLDGQLLINLPAGLARLRGLGVANREVGYFSVGQSNGVNDIAIYGANDTSPHQIVFRTNSQQRAVIDSQGNTAFNANIGVSGTSTLTGAVTAGGNVGTSNFASQLQGWRVTPAGVADFRHIYTDELQAKAFTADISQALVGSDVLTKSVAKLAQNFKIGANNTYAFLYVEELEGYPGMSVFSTWDKLRLRVFDRSGGGLVIADVWLTITKHDINDTVNNVQTYTVRFDDDGGVVGSDVYAGSMVLDYGQSGSGVIERTVLDAMGSPYSQVKTWVNDPSNPANYTIHNRTGNLDGIANASGFGFYGENTFLTGKLLVGDLTKAGQYMEYENGQLNIRGKITVTGGNAATKEDVDAVQVGGRNLAKGTANPFSVTGTNSANHAPVLYNTAPIAAGVMATLSFDWKVEGVQPSGTFRVIQSAGSFSSIIENIEVSAANSSGHFVAVVTMPLSQTNGLRVRMDYLVGVLTISNLKLELGNKATDWTPAPEDVDAAIDNIEIGGRNLWKDSRTSPEQVTVTQYGYLDFGRLLSNVAIKEGQTVTFGFSVVDVPEGEAVRVRVDFYRPDGTYLTLPYGNEVVGEGRSSITFDVPNLSEFNRIRFRAYPVGFTTPYSVKIYNEKLETGNRATDWTPAPEDVDAGIAAAETSAKGYADGAATAAESAAKTFATSEAAAALTAAESYTDSLTTRVENTLGLAQLEGINQTLITGNKVRTSLLEVTDIVAAGITAGHVEGLTLNFTKGKISTWNIGDGLLYTGSWDPSFSAGSGLKLDAVKNSIMAQHSIPGRSVEMFYRASDDWGLVGMKDYATVFQLGSTNQIAGINFDDSKLSTQNWELNKDGSFYFGAGGEIEGGLITGVIESSNWDGVHGSSFDLHNGHLLIGDAVRMSGDTSEIQVRDRSTGLDSFRIGDFPLTPTNFAGAGVDVLLSSNSVSTSAAAGSYQLNRTVYISSSGSLMTSTSYISNSLIVGGTYNLHAYLKVVLSLYQQVTTRPFILDEKFARTGGNGIKMQLKNYNTVVWEQNISTIPDDGVIPLSIFTSFQAVSPSLQLIITIDGEYEYRQPYGSETRIYNTAASIERFNSSSRLVLQALLARMEFSTKGMQAVFSSTSYFRCDSTAIEGRGTQTFISPDGKYKLRVSNAGIQKSVNGGAWTSL